MNALNFNTCHLGRMCWLSSVMVAMLALLAPAQPGAAQQFAQRTQVVGLERVSGTNGVAVADYDRDGDLDVYFVVKASYDPNDSKTWNRLFANQGDGTFSPVTTTPGLAGRDSSTVYNPMGNKMGAAWGDYDNDGWPDLFLTHLGPNQLFHNNGDGTFTDVTPQAGVTGGPTQLSSSALWFDYDHDGDLDLYVSNWEDTVLQASDRDTGNWLYENLGDGTFLDVSEASGLADRGLTWTSVALDANNDGLLDVYLANDFGRNKFYLNNGNKTFREMTAYYGLEDVHHGMGVAIADCDENGYFDIYLTNITESGNDAEINPLFLNTGANHFTHRSVEAGVSLAGWGWGTEFFDLENDGDEDLFVATGYFLPDYDNVLFRNTMESGGFGFEEMAQTVGLADSTAARGLAVLDYDEDGDLDLLISNIENMPSLYENPMGQGHWLKIELEGTMSNRDAFGSVVEVWAGGSVHRRYHHGAQFLAQNLLPVHVGLGEADLVERITVTWPSGHMDDVDTVAVDQTIRIKETVGLVDGDQPTSIDEEPAVPDALRLLGNYPNPFSRYTQIRFALAAPGDVEIAIFDALGRSVQVLRRSFPIAGEQMIPWDATSVNGAPLGPGLYFYKVIANHQGVGYDTGTMLYLK